MEKIIFEHPLNEKMRIFLRLEFLLKLIYDNNRCSERNVLTFFHALCELLDIIDRSNIRSELLKEIDNHRKRLQQIILDPEQELTPNRVDEYESLLKKFDAHSTQLLSIHKLGTELKNDRFLSAIRHRLSIPGGCCSFDLPSLHFWLSLPQEKRDIRVNEWLHYLAMLNDILTICLGLTRNSGKFMPFSSDGHFIQSAPNSVSLIRIALDRESNIYPQVSGHMSRYSIRFLPFDIYDNQKIPLVEFEVATC